MEAWREELYHHGIKGQKWGVRRYQNEDGTLTNAGRRRYYNEMARLVDQANRLEKASKKYDKRREKFEKISRKPTLTDVHLTLKKNAGYKYSKAYKNYMKAGTKYLKSANAFMAKYGGIDSLKSNPKLIEAGHDFAMKQIFRQAAAEADREYALLGPAAIGMPHYGPNNPRNLKG